MTGRRDRTKSTAADRVYLEIRKGIIAGAYAVSERLTEGALAEQMNVSRTPVREALQKLASDGFVEFTPHAGALVKGWSRRDVREIFEVRANLESMGARLAAQNASDDDVERLSSICDAMERTQRSQSDALPAMSEFNKAYHAEILRIAGNRRLTGLALNLMDVGFLVRSYGAFSEGDVSRSLADHRSLVEALKMRDGQWAEGVMRAHILAAASVFRGTETSVIPADAKRRRTR
ncbi:GntR family transcriptional regulator [Aurantimonas sp. A2-1-M11]|uniref:GntR family transcriptional regulator n=1 Tax=Aurantimonas sp. A2-1-M11 TaxID=3113712 RepID=UPI002F9246D6